MYLVDTSVWIPLLRGQSDQKGQFLESLLEEGEASLCEVVYAEICFGAGNKRQFEKYAGYFGNLPFLALPENWHRRAAEIGYSLRIKGHKPFLGDLLIALIALEHKVPLVTHDKDFRPYREFFGLELV